MKRRLPSQSSSISEKVNKVLHITLLSLLLISAKLWYLCIVQHEEKVEEANRPKKREIVEPAKRGTIRDRYNLPLAINKIEYRVCILYSQIRQIPQTTWETNEEGERERIPKRTRYIEQLSELLSKELQMDPERIEDLIHAKASLYFQMPFVIKAGLSEEQYYRLKAREREWPGLLAQQAPKRFYPQKRVAADIIGYTGAIDKRYYEQIRSEIQSLEHYLAIAETGDILPLPEGLSNPEEVDLRLQELQDRAYTLRDEVGKAGIEKQFEESLRGFHGKHTYETDARGNFLRELPDVRAPLSGQKLLLTISLELQQYIEELLVQQEDMRIARISGISAAKQETLQLNEPWVKGGAIVAMEPNSGEVIALASYPRFDPNDFVRSGNPAIDQQRQAELMRWLESTVHIKDIWDQKSPLKREKFDLLSAQIIEEEVLLSWDSFLTSVLSAKSTAKEQMQKIQTIEQAIEVQELFAKLLELSEQKNSYLLIDSLYQDEKTTLSGRKHKTEETEQINQALKEWDFEVQSAHKLLTPYLEPLTNNRDKILFIDLCRLIIDSERISSSLLNQVGKQTPSQFRKNSCALFTVKEVVQEMAQDLFHHHHFRQWRKEEGKEFLKEKREAEKVLGRYATPYIDYFDKEEKKQFQKFWNEHGPTFLLQFLMGEAPHNEDLLLYSEHFLTWYRELSQGAHHASSWKPSYDTLQTALSTIDKPLRKGYLYSMRSYAELTRPLLGTYRSLRKTENKQLEKDLAAAFYPKYGYGYGRSYAYRQACTQASVFKLVTAYEAMRQKYQASEHELSSFSEINPLTMTDLIEKRGRATYLGYDNKGKAIPQLYEGGRLPRSWHRNLGEIDLIKALEVSSNPYFSLLALHHLNNPEDLNQAASGFSFGTRTGIDLPNEYGGKLPGDLQTNRTGLYSFAIGQHTLNVTPLQTAVMLSAIANGGDVLTPRIVKQQSDSSTSLTYEFPKKISHTLPFPSPIRNTLLTGMHATVQRINEKSRYSLRNYYHNFPEAMQSWKRVKDQLFAKTGTAEMMERITLDSEYGTHKYNHTWLGSFSFSEENEPHAHTFTDHEGNPELVVVIYLRYGDFGKDAAPLAAQIVEKWREIKNTQKKELD